MWSLLLPNCQRAHTQDRTYTLYCDIYIYIYITIYSTPTGVLTASSDLYEITRQTKNSTEISSMQQINSLGHIIPLLKRRLFCLHPRCLAHLLGRVLAKQYYQYKFLSLLLQLHLLGPIKHFICPIQLYITTFASIGPNKAFYLSCRMPYCPDTGLAETFMGPVHFAIGRPVHSAVRPVGSHIRHTY